jgi:hypothetical protein
MNRADGCVRSGTSLGKAVANMVVLMVLTPILVAVVELRKLWIRSRAPTRVRRTMAFSGCPGEFRGVKEPARLHHLAVAGEPARAA